MKRTAAIALGVLVACCRCAFPLNPSLDVSQYAHFAWRYRDGFIKGEIKALAQTPDGYLWLGTSFGLVRFDGVRAVPWQPPPDQPLPSSNIYHLNAARDGTLWIGTRNGLASWKNGRLTQYAELAGLPIEALTEDREGSVWVGAYGFPDGKLCEIRRGVVQCHPEMANLGHGVFGLHEDGKGNLWAGVTKGLWRWKPGTPEFYAFPDSPSGVQGMANDGNGELLVSTKGVVKSLNHGKFQTAYPFPAAMQGLPANHILHDRDGGLWVSPYGGGIVHIHQGRTDLFSKVDGLTGDLILGLFEDREGTIWVATTTGLDRFRNLPVVTYSASQGLGAPYGGVLATRDGSIWFGALDGLMRLDRGQLAVYRQHGARKMAGAREVVVSGLTMPESLFEDSRGRIWIATSTGVGYFEGKRFTSTHAPGRYNNAITEDAAGNIWIANMDAGLIRISGDEIQQTSWIALGHRETATFVLADPRQGGIWLGFGDGGILWYRDGQVRASYSAAQGLAPGHVYELRFDGEDALWVATDGGLSRLKNGRIATLTSRNGMPCDGVQWMIGDNAGSVWMNTPCGLVRTARAELDAWSNSADKTVRTIRTTVFDASDGAMPVPRPTTFNPRVAKAKDGKLWFYGIDGFNVVDPLHLAFNKLPPPVHIEQITVDGKVHEASSDLRLPPLVRELEIDYTALSLAAPEKNRFRYKLEGYDRDWQDAGNRRQAYYTNLDPRPYRFRVRASNNDGVWNEAGASLDFSIAPAYYQTTWFALLVVAAVLAFLALLYQMRLRYLKHQFNIRLEARVGERTRLARDLHDTLLQGFQGALLKFQAVTYMLPDSPIEAQETLERVLDQAQDAVTDGRKAVQGLRSSTVIANDLARAINTFAQGVAADHAGPDCPECHVQVQEESRNLPPLIRDEVYQIACESLRNAFRHAQAKRIDVEIRYDPRQFRLRIVDNGKGIDPAVLSAGGRAGHHGLPGLRERAQLAGGKLSVSSQLNSGTNIELTVPAAIAYTKPPARRSMFLRKGAG